MSETDNPKYTCSSCGTGFEMSGEFNQHDCIKTLKSRLAAAERREQAGVRVNRKLMQEHRRIKEVISGCGYSIVPDKYRNTLVLSNRHGIHYPVPSVPLTEEEKEELNESDE